MNDKIIYAEVYSILNMLGESYIKKIPTKLYNLIKDNKDNEFKPKFNSLEEITKQNCSIEAISMIASIHYSYWCENSEEKDSLKQLFEKNFIEKEKIKNEQFSYENLFKNANKHKDWNNQSTENKESTKNTENTENTVSTDIVEVKKERFWHKIFKFIKNIFFKK